MIEHCRDFRRVKKLAERYPAKGLRVWNICISSDVHYFIEVEDGEDLGAWCFEPHPEGYLMHAAMGPKCRGKKALHSGIEAIEWMFGHTNCERVIAATPVELKHTHVLPRAAGFRFVEVRDGCRCSVLDIEDYYNKRVA